MNILHTITSINRGGAENHLVDLTLGQINKGYQVTVAYLKGNSYWRTKLESQGVQVINLGLKKYGEIQPIFKLYTLIKQLKPSIIHTHLPPAELYTRIAMLGISCKIPLVISKHNDEKFYQGLGQKFIGRWVAKAANRMIAISHTVKVNHCSDYLGFPAEKVKTIYYGIDPTLYQNISAVESQNIRSLWSVNDETYLIGTVARLVPQKALHILLDGFNLYLKNTNKPAKLVIVGIGDLELDLKKRAINLGIHEHIIWAGFREDIPVVMNALDVFALTSVYEGLGLVLMEAMSAGKPVVASNIGAISEVVIDQVTGSLFTSQDSVALAEAFKSLEDQKLRLRLGNAGKEKISTDFTLEQMIEQTLAVYEACL